MKKTILPLIVIALLALVLSASRFGAASGDQCSYYNPVNGCCMVWNPVLIPGGNWCSGDPGANQVNIYTGTSFGGFCETLPLNASSTDLSQVGWYNTTTCTSQTFRIQSVKTGPGAMVALYPQTNYGNPTGALRLGCRNSSQSNANTSGNTIQSLLTGVPAPGC